MGSGIPHSSELRPRVLTLQGGAEPEGPRDPRRRTKEAGAAPAVGHAHREPRGRAPPPPPRPRAARNGGRATKWQPAGRARGGVETPVAGHSPVPAVPSPEFGGRPCEDKWSGLAGHPRERSYGRRGSGSPGPPSPPPPRRMPSPRFHFANVPVVPRPPAPSLATTGSACRAGRVQLGAASVPVSSLGASVASASGLGLGLCTLEFSAVLSQRKKSQPHPPASLCVRLSRNFSGQLSKNAPARWPFPHHPPLLAHARGLRQRPWRAPVGL